MPTPIKTPREILEELISHYASKDNDGEYWGYDICCGKGENIAKALQALDAYYKARVRVDKGEIRKIFAKNSRLIGGYAQFYGITDLEFDKIANEIVSHSTQIIKIEGER